MNNGCYYVQLVYCRLDKYNNTNKECGVFCVLKCNSNFIIQRRLNILSNFNTHSSFGQLLFSCKYFSTTPRTSFSVSRFNRRGVWIIKWSRSRYLIVPIATMNKLFALIIYAMRFSPYVTNVKPSV